MNYQELKPIFESIEKKAIETDRLVKMKELVDRRTDKSHPEKPNELGQDFVVIIFEGQELSVNPIDLKNLIDKNIQDNSLTADFAELKLKAK